MSMAQSSIRTVARKREREREKKREKKGERPTDAEIHNAYKMGI